jgi:hypothetical protein
VERLRLLQRLSLAYYALLAAFGSLLFLLGIVGVISDSGEGLLGTMGLLILIGLGIPLPILLARALQKSWPWAYGLAFVLFMPLSLGLLAHLNFVAFQRLRKHGIEYGI